MVVQMVAEAEELLTRYSSLPLSCVNPAARGGPIFFVATVSARLVSATVASIRGRLAVKATPMSSGAGNA